jgi:hypothetical protein
MSLNSFFFKMSLLRERERERERERILYNGAIFVTSNKFKRFRG